MYRIDKKIELVDSFLVEYPLYSTPDGGVEQNAEDWWKAVCESTRALINRSGLNPSYIKGISFCCQMQGSVLVDRQGKVLRNPMIYLDGRSTQQIARYLYNGLLKIDKWNMFTTLKSLIITGGIAGTAKDPLWKYLWVRDNEPKVFEKTYKWLDVKDCLTLRCTGNYGMTGDSAHLTWVYDTRPGKQQWSKSLCKKFDVNMEHLPPVIQSTGVVGELTAQAAEDMGLVKGIPVFGGGGDTSLTAVGSGCLEEFDTHIYVGTSGWVVSNVNKRLVDVSNFIASIISAIPGGYSYSAEQETSGLCLQWVRDHLALDEIGMYLDAQHIADKNEEYNSLFDFLNEVVSQTDPGSGGVIFTPWLHGNRSPREDPHSRGMFFNLSINTGKRQMIRSVMEGVSFHKRWMLEAMEKKIPKRETLRFVGGGARSDVWCQIMADVTGRNIETIDNAQNAGTIGAAVVCAVGLGLMSFPAAKALIPTKKSYSPRRQFKEMYDLNYSCFSKLYDNNKKLFAALNQPH